MNIFEYNIREWYNSSGWVKKITRAINNTIVKEFHDHIIPWDFYGQQQRIQKMQAILWEYMPETRLVGNEQSYKVVQKKIQWEILGLIDESTLSIETLQHIASLIQKYEEYTRIENEFFDIIGTPAIKYTNSYSRKIYNLINPKSFRASTNIIIEQDTGKPYRVDVIHGESINHNSLPMRIKRTIRSFFIKILYEYQKYKLNLLLKDNIKKDF